VGLYGTTEEDILAGRITQELVAEVAGKVYAMMLWDLSIQRERVCGPGRGVCKDRGGW
jgi:hypothetical protein